MKENQRKKLDYKKKTKKKKKRTIVQMHLLNAGYLAQSIHRACKLVKFQRKINK